MFYGDGYDYYSSIDRYKKELHNWGQITDCDNSYLTIRNTIYSLNNVITDEDNVLFYWVVGHGVMDNYSDDDSYKAKLVHADNTVEYVCKTELMKIINSITHYNRRKIIWMTCYSGAMGKGSINPLNNRTTLITSSDSDERSYSYLNHPAGNNYYHTIFNYALFSLATGKQPDGNTCSYNQYYNSGAALEDSLLSVNELYSGIDTFVCSVPYNNQQHPCLFDSGKISDRIYLGENKEIKNVAIDNNKSYWLDRLELSNVTLGTGTDITIDTDIQTVIKKNTIVPKGSTLSIE